MATDERRVVLIVGPPGAGKSTLARQMARSEGLTMYESEMYGYPGSERLRRAVEPLYGDPNARAVVVRCCPQVAEQRWWESRIDSTETVVLDTDPVVCVERVQQRRRAGWQDEAVAAKTWRYLRGLE